jgi:hypothetical protein
MRGAVGLATAILVTSGVAYAQISFGPPIAYAMGSDPEAVSIADFDGDGDLDVAATIHSPARLSIVRNLGDGTFGPPEISLLTPNTDPAGLVARDFDQDGKFDLMVVYRYVGSVKFLHNTGNASFVGGDYVVVGDEPNEIIAFDFDGDSDEDVAVTNRLSNTVSFVRNLGGGQFELSDTVGVGTGPHGMAAGHFNGDGRLEVVVAAHDGGKLNLLSNNGGGDFSPMLSIPLGNGEKPESVGVADFDNDGDDDIAATVSDPVLDEISIVWQTSPGAFTAPTYYGAGGLHPVGLVLHDFDLDTLIDVALVNSGSNSLSCLRNLRGTFGPAQVHPLLGPVSDFVSCGDFDDDHYADLVCTNDGGNSISVLLNARANPSSYCIAAPNSAGAGAWMNSTGPVSIAANDFVLRVGGAPASANGMFFYGLVPQQMPYYSGYLCIHPPLARLGPPIQTNRSGMASRALDFTQYPASYGESMITAGSVWNFQFWYRDSSLGSTNFSDGWRVVFEP